MTNNFSDTLYDITNDFYYNAENKKGYKKIGDRFYPQIREDLAGAKLNFPILAFQQSTGKYFYLFLKDLN